MDVETRTDADIYAEHAAELVRFATGLVGRADAPDIVAEAFARLLDTDIWRATDNHRALLYRRVYLEAQSWTRSHHRRRDRERRAASTERTPDFPDLQPEVAAAVQELSPQQRAVVFLTYWNDLTPASIAALLDVSDGTVRKQLARARTHLKKALS